MDGIKVSEEIVCIFPYCLLMFRPAEKKTVSNGKEKALISLLKSLSQKVLILSARFFSIPETADFSVLFTW